MKSTELNENGTHEGDRPEGSAQTLTYNPKRLPLKNIYISHEGDRPEGSAQSHTLTYNPKILPLKKM